MTAAPTGAASAVGRQRRLARLGGVKGVIAGIALDHRDSLRVLLERRRVTLAIPELRAVKLALARTLAPLATAIMLDDELGQAALEAGAVPASVGLIMPLEAQGYETAGDGRVTTLLPDFGPSDALRYGADACKLLVPYRADDARSAAQQDELVRSTVAACHDVGLPLVVEPVVYRWSSESADGFVGVYSGLVVEAATRLRPLGVDLLKLPFPVHEGSPGEEVGALEACRALVRLAGSAGASGFLVGRGIWGPALASDLQEVERLAATISGPAFERCRAAAEATARPLPVAARL